jgi:hypothetical protein
LLLLLFDAVVGAVAIAIVVPIVGDDDGRVVVISYFE